MTATLLSTAIEQAMTAHASRCALAACGAQPAMSYAQLERTSRGLARRLAAAGCQAGDRVGVWWPKSHAAVVGLLAVLRLGGVYVPLDAGAPGARIEALVEDAGCRLLLADGPRAAQARGWAIAATVISDLDLDHLAADPGPSLERGQRTSDDGAYILYTSGSTGVPKGVLLSHGHALGFIRWAAEQVALGPDDRVASHAPFHFDLSIFDLWATLSRGATVCLLEATTKQFPAAVAEWMAEQAISVWYSVPSALVQLLPFSVLAAAAPLRQIIFAGEVFPKAALDGWRRALPNAHFANWYGPTETNVCLGHRLPPWREDPTPSPGDLPIGVGLPDFALRVGDDPAHPVAAGESGFLWVRGPGILLGYWNDEERTAKVTRWHRDQPGAPLQRWYNTGDVVCQDGGGGYRFRGRRDHVVKCRGYRISLLEIETALTSCAGVGQAVVVPVPDAAHVRGLAAYVLARESHAPQAAELKAALAAKLPAYMIPDPVVIADALPLTSSGKLDRQALAAECAGAGTHA